jgi:serine/threonine protein kinase
MLVYKKISVPIIYYFSSLGHKHVVQFYGIYTNPDKEYYIVTEYMNKGSLRDFLLSDEGSILSVQQLISLYKYSHFFLIFVDVEIWQLEWCIFLRVT